MSHEEAIDLAVGLLRPWLSKAADQKDFAKYFRRIDLRSVDKMKRLFDPATETELIQLTESASGGDAQARAELYEWAYVAAFCDARPIPSALKAFIADMMFDEVEKLRRKRGKSPDTDFPRNFVIMCAVGRVAKMGFSPNRTQQDRDCSCSIVAQALKRIGAPFIMSEDNVERIWGDRLQLPDSLRQYAEGNDPLLAELDGSARPSEE